MATYKVIQDIEAEDKFLGPLTLKQFIFAAITAVCLYLSFIFITKQLWYLVLPLLPIIFVGGFLAFPWGRDQPTEVWLLGKIRFYFKPRLRIWDQSGIQELVTITAPKKIEEHLTDNLSQGEVKSRLKALAETIDSRGWAVKNADINMFSQPGYVHANTGSDRLIEIPTVAFQGPAVDVHAADDILDEQNNPVAQQLSQMIDASTQAHRQETLQHMQDIREGKLPPVTATGEQNPAGGNTPSDFWFLDQPVAQVAQPQGYTTFATATAPVTNQANASLPSNKPAPLSPEEQALLEKLHKQQGQDMSASYGHMRVIQPIGKQKPAQKSSQASPGLTAQDSPLNKAQATDGKQQAANQGQSTSGNAVNPAILGLANNDDLTVATIAHEANKNNKKEPPQDEVVISLR